MTSYSLPIRWALLPFALAISACQPPSGPSSADLRPKVPEEKVTKSNYLNGSRFCEVYASELAGENAKRIEVPRKYENSESGTWSIYVWTTRPFDPKKPSYVFLEGGPGGNSHGWEPFTDETINEIRFDQRGVGCSAPETYEDYSDASLYSSTTTARDIEEIRKSFGIEKLTVFGSSYGTVPATIYGNLFPKAARSIILEGVLFSEGDGTMRHRSTLLNQMLDRLTPAARQAFREFMASGATEVNHVYTIVEALKTSDDGYELLRNFFQSVFGGERGTPSEALAHTIAKLKEGRKSRKYPQAPGSVDGNILIKLFCKELGLEETYKDFPVYSPSSDRYEPQNIDRRAQQECTEYGVPNMVTRVYSAADHPFSAPAYYFQGLHDGATPAESAIKHWRRTAKGPKHLILKKRGGHGPNVLALVNSKDPALRTQQHSVFKKAVLGASIDRRDIEQLNSKLTNQVGHWLIYKNTSEMPESHVGSF